MTCEQTLCAQFGKDDWILLNQSSNGGWTFGIARSNAHGSFHSTSEADAKMRTLLAVRKYLVSCGRKAEASTLFQLPWRVVMRRFVTG